MLASDIAGFAQVVDSGVTGLLVAPKQPDAWAGAMQTLIDDAPLRRAMGDAGLRKAQLYDWVRVVDSVLDVYQDAHRRAAAREVASGVHNQAPEVG